MSRQRRRRHGQRPEVRARRTDRPPAILQPAGPQDQRRHHRAKARILRYRPPPRKPATTEQTIPLAEYCRRRHARDVEFRLTPAPSCGASPFCCSGSPPSAGASPSGCASPRSSPARAAAACADSSGGSSSSARSPRSSRNWRVAEQRGPPWRVAMADHFDPATIPSALTIWDDTVTPRMSSISPRVTGWRQATIASVSMTAREYFGGSRDSAAPGSAAFQDGSESASPWPAAPVPGRRRPNWPARFPTARAGGVVDSSSLPNSLRMSASCIGCTAHRSAVSRTRIASLSFIDIHIQSGPTCVGWKIRLIFFSQTRGGAVWQLVGLITRRS